MPSDSGRDVEEQDVLDVALEHAGLERGADRDGFVGVDALVGVLPGELLDQIGDRGHAGGATHEDHAVDLVLGEAGVADRLLERPAARLEQIARELLELRPGEREVEVERTVARRGDERQVDRGLLQRRELDLRLLRRFLQPLDGHLVGREVDAVRVLELADQPVHDPLVPVVTTEVRVPGGRLDLEHALAEVEDRHVERATPEVEHEDGLVVVLVEPVGQRGRGGLVDDAQHLEARDLAGLLGGLALGVAEVGGHGDHGLGDGVAEVGLGVALELLQDAGRDLLRVVGLAVDVDRPVGAHVALHRADRAIRVGDRLALGDLTDEDLAGLGERHDRRASCASPRRWGPRRARRPRGPRRRNWWCRGRYRRPWAWGLPPGETRLYVNDGRSLSV